MVTSHTQIEQTGCVVENELRELLDREAIRALPTAYAHYIWANDVEAIVSLFSSNGGFSMTQLDARGPEALRKYFHSIASTPRPFVHQHHIEFRGADRAVGYVYLELRFGAEGFRMTHFGVYEDTYVKEHGAWKFEDRKLSLTAVPE